NCVWHLPDHHTRYILIKLLDILLIIIKFNFTKCIVISEDNAIDYGEQANTDAVKLRVYSLVQPIGQILNAAEERYKKVGLTVPIQLYEATKLFALETIPWVFNEFKAVANETDRERVTAQFIGEVHGFNYMSERLDKLRQSRPLNVTGSAENLLGRIHAMDVFMQGALDGEIANASHPVWVAFHQRIKQFLATEMPKLYKAIDELPCEQSKLGNLQVLIADLSHASLPPL
ncbi:unnamed protein product, partial [Medioppia subpectinata]